MPPLDPGEGGGRQPERLRKLPQGQAILDAELSHVPAQSGKDLTDVAVRHD
jgi:hypothetical protein